MDDLIKICAGAVRESLLNVFGDKFDSFVENFEKSFRSTLMTLLLINKSARDNGGEKETPEIRRCSSEVATASSSNRLENFAFDSGFKDCWADPQDSNHGQPSHHEEIQENMMTLHLINKSAKDNGGEKETPEIRRCSSEVATASSSNRLENFACDSGFNDCWADLHDSNHGQPSRHEEIQENMTMNFRNNQLTLHDTEIGQQMVSVIPSRNSSEFNNQSILSTLEKSVVEQVLSNDLKRFEIGLTMKKLKLKERQLALREKANLLERWKLSFGFSKASFKVEKFKTQLEDTKHAELLRKCIDCLVAGLLVMLAFVGYGVFVYSHKRLTEATSSCTPAEELKSWWLPKPMASFNSGLQILKCQFQVLTRMLAGGFMVLAIAYLLLQRSSTSNQAMPVTFIVLLLGIACGFAGKLCIDTLGGSGNHWLLFWEILCGLHLFSNLWTSILYIILHGPLNVSEGKKTYPSIPYWMRRCLFYSTTCFFLPLLCGFLPFASLGEWKDHFSSLILDHRQYDRTSILD